MREPLMPEAQCVAMAAKDADIKAIIKSLPPLHRSTLQFIVRFLKVLPSFESTNKMNS